MSDAGKSDLGDKHGCRSGMNYSAVKEKRDVPSIGNRQDGEPTRGMAQDGKSSGGTGKEGGLGGRRRGEKGAKSAE